MADVIQAMAGTQPSADATPAPAKDKTADPTPGNSHAAGALMVPAGHLVVPAEEWNRLRTVESSVAEIERERQAQLELKEAEKLRVIAEKEGAEAALTAQKTSLETKLNETLSRYQQLERQTLDTHRDTAIAQLFAGRTFAGETSEDQAEMMADLKELIEKKIEARRDANNKIVVVDKSSNLPVMDSLRAVLDGKRYANFFAPRGGGGGTSGGNGDKVAKTEDPQAKPKEGSLDQIIAEFKAKKDKYPAVGL